MLIKFLNLEIKIITRKSRVLQDIRENGRLKAIKNYNDRYKCGLKKAMDYIKKVEVEATNEANHS